MNRLGYNLRDFLSENSLSVAIIKKRRLKKLFMTSTNFTLKASAHERYEQLCSL